MLRHLMKDLSVFLFHAMFFLPCAHVSLGCLFSSFFLSRMKVLKQARRWLLAGLCLQVFSLWELSPAYWTLAHIVNLEVEIKQSILGSPNLKTSKELDFVSTPSSFA